MLLEVTSQVELEGNFNFIQSKLMKVCHKIMIRTINFILLILLISSFYQDSHAINAQGEGISRYKIFHEEVIDNYFVSISISPIKPIVGQQVFSIKVFDKLTNKPVENLIIKVFATPLFDDKKKYSPALSTSTMEGSYQAILRLEKNGFWIVDFEIDNGTKMVKLSEQIEILERNRTINNRNIPYGFIFIQLIFILGILIIVISARRRKKRLNL